MERQKMRQHQRQQSVDTASMADPIITPPGDFQDQTANEDQDCYPSGDGNKPDLLDPPAMFKSRPRTELFWSSGGGGGGGDDRCVFPPWPVAAIDESASQAFHQELERLKSHSLLLRFPADGTARVHYRSSKSVVEYSSTLHQYRIRTGEGEAAAVSGQDDYRTVYAVSETESEDDDEETINKDEATTTAVTMMTCSSARSRPRSPSASGSSAARLSSSSGISSSQVTTSSTTSDVDADSGIDGVSPRVSAVAFGESTLSPSQSILFMDSVSSRNSAIPTSQQQQQLESSLTTPAAEETTECSDLQQLSLTVTHDEGIGPRASVVVEGDPRRDRSYRVALELLHTERTYVDILHLLDQVFQFRIDQENRAHNMFQQELIPQMFSNIKSLFKLHHDFFLPRLEERMQSWEQPEQPDCRRIGDIMVSFAPFLKMYAEYVRNFDHAAHLIASMSAKSSRFAAIIDEIQQLPQCGQLSLQHHMLTPIQRVPRYEMLLRDYLRRLPDDSLDRAETERALHLVSTAANHANEAMKKIDQFKQLLEIQESLGGAVDLVSPTRELIKEGKIVKISARSGDHQERYLFLFTDLLLLCSPRLISNRVIGVGAGLTPYRVRARFNVAQVEVLEGDNLETANTFYLRESAKTVELYTGTAEEKEAWIDSLFAAMTELTRRKSSLRISPVQQQQQQQQSNKSSRMSSVCSQDFGDGLLGKTAPTLVRVDSVTRCFQCQGQFSVMRRKHHCHSCGKVACNRCSSHKLPLPYDGTKAMRVCDACHQSLTSCANQQSSNSRPNSIPSPSSSPELTPSPPSLRTGLLEVNVETPSVMAGYLSLKTRGKTWQRRWFALRSDFVLYSYRSDQGEDRAVTATPVPGFSVSLLSGSNSLLSDGSSSSSQIIHLPIGKTNSINSSINGSVAGSVDNNGMISERDRSFKMSHTQKSYHFQAVTRQDAEKWVQLLQMASRADLPSPTLFDNKNIKEKE